MSTETSTDYANETEAAEDALDRSQHDFRENWTRAERLAEAQVHATLAVAAAYHMDYEETVEIADGRADLAAQLAEAKNFAEGYAATADDLLRLLLPMFTDAEKIEFERSGALPTRDLAAGRPFDPTHIDTQAGFPGRIARNVKAVGFPTHREGPDETEAEFAARLERINIMNADTYFTGSERADEVGA